MKRSDFVHEEPEGKIGEEHKLGGEKTEGGKKLEILERNFLRLETNLSIQIYICTRKVFHSNHEMYYTQWNR